MTWCDTSKYHFKKTTQTRFNYVYSLLVSKIEVSQDKKTGTAKKKIPTHQQHLTASDDPPIEPRFKLRADHTSQNTTTSS